VVATRRRENSKEVGTPALYDEVLRAVSRLNRIEIEFFELINPPDVVIIEEKRGALPFKYAGFIRPNIALNRSAGYRASLQPAIMIPDLSQYFDEFETSPRQASKYSLSGTPTNRYGSYRS
jgi:hypothetical protein